MSEFYNEVAEKSRIARGARHKVNGSKSKRVSLSSDRMSQSQLRRMCGPCVTYRMAPGVPDDELDKWPADLRAEYRKRFGR